MDDNIPIAPCLCQHHGAEYAEITVPVNTLAQDINFQLFADSATIISVSITTTKRCCIVVNVGFMTGSIYAISGFEIERPSGTIQTDQEDRVLCDDLQLMHYAAWEVLDAGTYTYYFKNRSFGNVAVMAAWIKAVASDCDDR